MQKGIIIILIAFLFCASNIFAGEKKFYARAAPSGKAVIESSGEALGASMMKWGVVLFLAIGILACTLPQSKAGS